MPDSTYDPLKEIAKAKKDYTTALRIWKHLAFKCPYRKDRKDDPLYMGDYTCSVHKERNHTSMCDIQFCQLGREEV